MHLVVLGECTARGDAGDAIALDHREMVVLATLIASAHHRAELRVLARTLADAGIRDVAPDDAIARLRAALGSERIVAEHGDAVRLRCASDELDATVFEQLLADVRATRDDERTVLDALHRALTGWTAPAFGPLARLEAIRPEAERLERLRAEAEDLVLGLMLHARRDGDALTFAEHVLARDSLRESVHVSRILALYRSGRRAEAFRAHREITEELARCGRPASPALADLELAMVLQLPQLDAPRTAMDLDVGQARDRAVDDDAPALRGPVALVGRRAERRWFDARLSEAIDGIPFFALLEGEAGIGKSCLARHVARVARDRGWEVLSARCDERVDMPLWPLVPRVLPRLAEIAARDSTISAHARLLARLAELVPDDGGATSVPALQQAAFRAALRSLATISPVLIVVDDLQWADAQSLDLLLTAARLMADGEPEISTRVGVIGTVRPPLADAPAAVLDQIRREPFTSRLVLRGLDDLEVDELVRRFGVHQAPGDWVAELAHVTGGNPLFVESAVRSVLLAGRIGAEDIIASIPSEMHSAITARLDGLDERTREFAVAAAVVGEPWDVDLVCDVLGCPREDAMAAIDVMLELGVADADPGERRFAHPLFGAALVRTLSSVQIRRLHAAAASSLSSKRASGHPVNTLLAFRHFAAARENVDARSAVPIALDAGAHAETLFAWGQAAKCYEHALQWLPSADVDQRLRGQLLRRAGMARLHNGEPGAAKWLLEMSTSTLAESDDRVELARAWIGRVRAQAVTAPPGEQIDIDNLEELAEDLESDAPAVAAEIWANLVQPFWMAGRLELARAAAQRALEIARPLGDDAASLRALWQRSMTEWSRLELADARESLQRAKQHGTSLVDRKELTGPMMRLPLTHFWLGEIVESTRSVGAARSLSREINYTLENGLFLNAQAQLALARGALDEAEDACSSCLSGEATSGYTWATPLAFPTLARLRLLRDDAVGVRVVTRRWITRGSRSVHEYAATCLTGLLEGSPFEPRRVDAGFMRLGGDTAAGLVIELAFERGSSDLCDGAVELILELRSRGQRFTTTMALYIPRLMALASSLRVDDHAMQELDDVQRDASALGLHLEVAYCEYAKGIHLRRAGELSSARRSFGAAERLASTLDALYLARRCRENLADVGDGRVNESRTEAGPALAETVSILFVDIAESTSLTERMGDWAFRSRSRRLEQLLRTTVDQNRGRLAFGVTLGDGILADFPSARDAARCAVMCAEVASREDLPVHVGLHAGDVVREAGSIFGGAVNIAARVCSLSEPGEVLASETFCQVASTSAPAPFIDRGTHELKGIRQPMRIYALGRPTELESGPPRGVA
jgi:class 3 adenylate cyclase